MSETVAVELVDLVTNVAYVIHLSPADVERVSTDMASAIEVLRRHQASLANEIADGASGLEHLTESSSSHSGEPTSPTSEPPDQVAFVQFDTYRWPHEVILLLISLYKENEWRASKMTAKKFWNLLVPTLQEKGYPVTWSQCKSKMSGLKNTYKCVRDHNAKSGNNRHTWKYYNIMGSIFGKKPWATPEGSTIDSVLELRSHSPPQLPGISRMSENSSEERPSKCMYEHVLIAGSGGAPVQPALEHWQSSEVPVLKHQVEDMLKVCKQFSGRGKKTQSLDAVDKLIRALEEQREERRQFAQALLQRQDRLLGLLEKLFEDK